MLSACLIKLTGSGFPVLNQIIITLLGQKTLAIDGEFQLLAVIGDQGVEKGRPPLGAQDAPEPLRLFLTRTEGTGDLDGDRGIGQVNGVIGDLETTSRRRSPARNAAYKRSRSPELMRPLISGAPR